jgi:hypothetical protein
MEVKYPPRSNPSSIERKDAPSRRDESWLLCASAAGEKGSIWPTPGGAGAVPGHGRRRRRSLGDHRRRRCPCRPHCRPLCHGHLPRHRRHRRPPRALCRARPPRVPLPRPFALSRASNPPLLSEPAPPPGSRRRSGLSKTAVHRPPGRGAPVGPRCACSSPWLPPSWPPVAAPIVAPVTVAIRVSARLSVTAPVRLLHGSRTAFARLSHGSDTAPARLSWPKCQGRSLPLAARPRSSPEASAPSRHVRRATPPGRPTSRRGVSRASGLARRGSPIVTMARRGRFLWRAP